MMEQQHNDSQTMSQIHVVHDHTATSTPASRDSISRIRTSIEANRKKTGFILLVFVVLLWGGSSFLLQKLFTLIRYSKPLLTTLTQTGLTSLLLIPKLIQRWKTTKHMRVQREQQAQRCVGVNGGDGENSERSEFVSMDVCCNRNNVVGEMAHQSSSNATSLERSANNLELSSPNLNELSISLLEGHRHENAYSHPHHSTIDHIESVPTILCSWDATLPLGFLWFAGQICFNLSLIYATVPTSIIVSSTSIFFTYALMIAIFNEHFDFWNFLAMLLSFFGVGLVASNTPIHRNLASVKDTPLGYTLSLISAISYAFFVVYLKRWSSKSFIPPAESSTLSDILSLGNLDSPLRDSEDDNANHVSVYHDNTNVQACSHNEGTTNSTGIPNSPVGEGLPMNDQDYLRTAQQVQKVASTLTTAIGNKRPGSIHEKGSADSTAVVCRTEQLYSREMDLARRSQQHGYQSQETSDYDRSDDFMSIHSESVCQSPRNSSSRESMRGTLSNAMIRDDNDYASPSLVMKMPQGQYVRGSPIVAGSGFVDARESPLRTYGVETTLTDQQDDQQNTHHRKEIHDVEHGGVRFSEDLNVGKDADVFRQGLTLTSRELRSREGGLTSGSKEIPKTVAEEELEMTSLFGSIGLMITVAAPFIILIAHFTSLERFEVPSSTALEWMLVNGLLGTVLSNYLWGLTVILLNPIVTTIGTNLQIPLVILADSSLLLDHRFKVLYIVGSLMTLIGVIVVSIRTTRNSCNQDDRGHQGPTNEDLDDDQDST